MVERKRRDRRAYRRCPSCGVVSPSIGLRRVTGKPDIGPERPMRCAVCGHVAPLLLFMIVDPPTRTGGGEG